MARLNCVVRGVGESPFRGGAAPDGRGQAVQEGGERDGRDLEDAADRRENLPPARCARVARRRRERPGLHQRSTCCKPRREEGRRLISFRTGTLACPAGSTYDRATGTGGNDGGASRRRRMDLRGRGRLG